ncbi:MAG: glycerol-3-phosphate acyltransferase [Candidatus Aminicenantaceae bacterium]
MVWKICLLVGYILGSISPSYILGKILKKIDIREHGTRNAGTVNTYKTLGPVPALITASFDISKGLLAMYIAHVLGAPLLCVNLAGFAAIAGHVFPFYLKFRGGQGVATATAILIYYLILFYARNWLPYETLILLTIAVISFSYIAKKGEVVGITILPLLGIFIIVFSPFQIYQIFILGVIVYILLINILNIRHEKLLKPPSEKAKKELNWRLYLRPLAVLLIVNYMKTDKKETLVLIGSIVIFFLLLDLIRLFSKKINIFFFQNVKDLYKSKEYKKFSSITLFLFACFLTILLFERNIATLAISYLIFGDFFSKFFGLLFGRTKIFEKTFEGSLAHFNACLISGYIMLQFTSLPLHVYLTGAMVATTSEVLPLGVDDNFSVALLSASTMFVFHLF